MDKPVKEVAEPAEVSEPSRRAQGKIKHGPRKGVRVSAADNTANEARKRVSRNFPASSFEEALEFAKTIFKVGSGSPVRRLTLFNELGKSPESSASRQAITNSSKYGLVKGTYKAEQLELTQDGYVQSMKKALLASGPKRGSNWQFRTSSFLQDFMTVLSATNFQRELCLLMRRKSLM